MELMKSAKKGRRNVVWVRAYKGDAMTFLAFDLHESMLENCVGFSIRIKANEVNGKYKLNYYLLNRLTFNQEILDKNGIESKDMQSSLYSPFQKFNWVHVPATDHKVSTPYFGDYTYEVTPRYLVDDILLPIDPKLTVALTIDVSPFDLHNTKIGFARAFISSQAYVRRFGMNNKVRPVGKDLMFDIRDVSGSAPVWNSYKKKYVDKDYAYEEQHKYLGWQARERVLEFLEEVINAPVKDNMSLEVFAYDLNEPVIVDGFLKLAAQGKLRIILDNAGSHGAADSYESQFEQLFNQQAKGESVLLRGKYSALSHSKVMIQLKNGKPQKILTGSTNFSTNGLYINANHIIVFDNKKVAELYSNVFANSFGQDLMKNFKKTNWAIDDFEFNPPAISDMTIRFAPHNKEVATRIFDSISAKIESAKSDVLFAIMQDTSASSILKAVRDQVVKSEIFTYGITDSINKNNDSVMLYKPNSKRGVRVAARGPGVTNILPEPFNTAKSSGLLR